MKPITRHHAREYALQAIYQWQISSAPISDIEAEFLAEHIVQDLDLEYFQTLLREIPKCIDELDQYMVPYLKRAMSDLDPVELAVLRIGIYELAKRPDVPYPVIINEALELTKKFGSIEGYKFVNGVLDQVARQLRTIEVAANKKKDTK